MNDNVILWLSGFLAGVAVSVVLAILLMRWGLRIEARQEQRRRRRAIAELRLCPPLPPREAWERDADFWKGDHS